MSVIDKINFLLNEKGLSKKEFAIALRNSEPRLIATGEIPSEQTIYRYLNGSRELKVELIPYIAEVLHVSEQELFTFDLEYTHNFNFRYSKDVREIINLLSYAPSSVMLLIKDFLTKYKKLYDEGIEQFKKTV